MNRSTGCNPVESVSTDEVSAPDLFDGRMPTIDFFPADVVRDRTARWRGVYAKTMQVINHVGDPHVDHLPERLLVRCDDDHGMSLTPTSNSAHTDRKKR